MACDSEALAPVLRLLLDGHEHGRIAQSLFNSMNRDKFERVFWNMRDYIPMFLGVIIDREDIVGRLDEHETFNLCDSALQSCIDAALRHWDMSEEYCSSLDRVMEHLRAEGYIKEVTPEGNDEAPA